MARLVRGATRILIACALAEGVSMLLRLPQPYWAMITALAILQNSTVQTLNAGRDQTIGAVIGAITGVAAILLTLQTGHREIVFFLALVPLALATAWRPSLRLSCVTLIIVVLVPTDASLITRALDRVLEITTGVASGVLVAYVLFRSRAQRLAYDRGTNALRAMARQSRLILTADADHRRDHAAIDAMHDRIAVLLNDTVSAADDAQREGGSPAPHTHRFATRLVPLLRRLQSDLLFIDRAVSLLPADNAEPAVSPGGDAPAAAQIPGVWLEGSGAGTAFGCRPTQAVMSHAGEALAQRLAILAQDVGATQPIPDQATALDQSETALDAAIDALDKERSLALRFVLRMAARDTNDLAKALLDEHAPEPMAPS